MLLSAINLAYYQELMAGMREAIGQGRFADFCAATQEGWAARRPAAALSYFGATISLSVAVLRAALTVLEADPHVMGARRDFGVRHVDAVGSQVLLDALGQIDRLGLEIGDFHARGSIAMLLRATNLTLNGSGDAHAAVWDRAKSARHRARGSKPRVGDADVGRGRQLGFRLGDQHFGGGWYWARPAQAGAQRDGDNG